MTKVFIVKWKYPWDEATDWAIAGFALTLEDAEKFIQHSKDMNLRFTSRTWDWDIEEVERV